jgi:hypothetical protein
MIEWEKGREIARGRDNKLHGERKRERERERERDYILFKNVASVPSVMDSPMNGTTASTDSPSNQDNKTKMKLS